MRPGLRFKVLTRDNYTCRYCGAKAPDVPLHVDHVLPKSRGGKDVVDNLVTACKPCNEGKHASLTEQAQPDMTEDEFREQRAELLELAQNWFWHDLAGMESEWEDFVGRPPTRREVVLLGRLILGFGFDGVRRAMRVIAARDGVYGVGEPVVDLDIFEIHQMLKRWRTDGLA